MVRTASCPWTKHIWARCEALWVEVRGHTQSLAAHVRRARSALSDDGALDVEEDGFRASVGIPAATAFFDAALPLPVVPETSLGSVSISSSLAAGS